MIRIGQVIGIKPEVIEEYPRIHAEVWPGVLERIAASNIRNFTIFLRRPENLLFAYMEYHGTDWEADPAKIAADPMLKYHTYDMPQDENLQAMLATHAYRTHRATHRPKARKGGLSDLASLL